MFAFGIDFTTNMSLMNTGCRCACVCVCGCLVVPTTGIKKHKNNRIIRDLGYWYDWKCDDAYYACKQFQDNNRWLPRNMYRAAKRITMDKATSVKVKDKQQMLLWGQILFYMNSQVENLLHLTYLSGDKSFNYKLVEFYIEKWLKPHRAGIAKRKGLTH